MKTYKTKAIKSSEKPLHVLATMFIKGEVYFVTKGEGLNDKFVTVRGKFRNSLSGFEYKEQAILKSICKEYLKYI